MKTKLFTKLFLIFALANSVMFAGQNEDYFSSFSMANKIYNSWDKKTQMFIDNICYKAQKEAEDKYPDKPFLRYCYQNHLISIVTEEINKSGEF